MKQTIIILIGFLLTTTAFAAKPESVIPDQYRNEIFSGRAQEIMFQYDEQYSEDVSFYGDGQEELSSIWPHYQYDNKNRLCFRMLVSMEDEEYFFLKDTLLYKGSSFHPSLILTSTSSDVNVGPNPVNEFESYEHYHFAEGSELPSGVFSIFGNKDEFELKVTEYTYLEFDARGNWIKMGVLVENVYSEELTDESKKAVVSLINLNLPDDKRQEIESELIRKYLTLEVDSKSPGTAGKGKGETVSEDDQYHGIYIRDIKYY